MAESHSQASALPGPAAAVLPGLVLRSEIPVSIEADNATMEERPLQGHAGLRTLLPLSAVRLAWVLARHGQEVRGRSHVAPVMLIVVKGTATLLGGEPRQLQRGDVVTVARGQKYGFTQVGVDGLHAIQVTLHDEPAASQGILNLERLKQRNDGHVQNARAGRFSCLVQYEGLARAERVSMVREAAAVLSHSFRATTFLCHAVSRDQAQILAPESPPAGATAGAHDASFCTRDPVLRAAARWFPYQALVLDEAGKAVLLLVLETVNSHLSSLAARIESDQRSPKEARTHAAEDAGHQVKWTAILEGHAPSTYARLERVLEDAWSIVHVITDRIASRVECSAAVASRCLPSDPTANAHGDAANCPVRVVPKAAIPSIQQVQHEGEIHLLGELRDFRWNSHLREFMRGAVDFSVSWVQLLDGEVLEPHVHPIGSMMIIYAGSGDMLGALATHISEGQVIFVPPGAEHGFVGGPDGLYALSIQFGAGLYTVPERPRVHFTADEDALQALLAYSGARLREFLALPLFGLLADGALDEPEKRRVYLGLLRTWQDGVRRIRLASQATCSDDRDATFQGSECRKEPEATPAVRDATIDVVASWFAYQMYTLDSQEKAALVRLVVRNATDAYSGAATGRSPVAHHRPGADITWPDRDTDEAVLSAAAPTTYAQMQTLVGEAWDLIAAMTARMTELLTADLPTRRLAVVAN